MTAPAIAISQTLCPEKSSSTGRHNPHVPYAMRIEPNQRFADSADSVPPNLGAPTVNRAIASQPGPQPAVGLGQPPQYLRSQRHLDALAVTSRRARRARNEGQTIPDLSVHRRPTRRAASCRLPAQSQL